jgi:hypothetical protein
MMMLSGQGSGGYMTYAEMITRLEREKELIVDLNKRLEQELELIVGGDVQSLEETMPHKQKIIKNIAKNRKDNDDLPRNDPEPEDANRIRLLQQDLTGLWKKATGLNELSKSLVKQRLSDIDAQLEVFFTGMKKGYSRDGKKSSLDTHTIKTGA